MAMAAMILSFVVRYTTDCALLFADLGESFDVAMRA